MTFMHRQRILRTLPNKALFQNIEIRYFPIIDLYTDKKSQAVSSDSLLTAAAVSSD